MSMRATFLGTGGAVPTTARAPSAFLVNRDGERLLFDCGEGTQRQMMRYGTGFGVSHLFVTHLHGDHILGIPGLIQTLDFNDRDDSLAIHGPPGSKGHLEQLVHAGGYQPGFHVSVHEVRPGNVAYRADDYEVRAFDTEHRTASVGYALVEDDRPGRFDREKAEELGVPVGPAFGRLHAGEDVELEDGTVVRSEQVVGDPRPGRTVVYTGDTRPLNSTVEVACDADLLVHDATFTDEEAERAKQTAHSTAREAARVARDADVRRFALTHISARYAADPSPLLEQAREVYDGEAFVAEDGQKLEVPYADSDGGGAETGE
ncbi:ribonuclease Z [Haloferax volcanii DS2]|uniref:Ribonuclease Z n=4 Tax=Haloferacaceae TaxID=1644056 RepID=RNZ_HALVD|nr:RecName: Full=Ribonuclease Z; Short=RNase Z; AltName: Full=tRNA 3 endonuclease; AltName: Full=tRNase Z [Haloferax volcanii DS2]ADE02929.2 ribonuclease Z [Haloferax volcanii DS2]